MPKVLSLKKNVPPKNQKAITQFFKTANPPPSEKIPVSPAKSQSSQEKCKDERPLKRKNSSSPHIETTDITDDSCLNNDRKKTECIKNGYHTPKKFKCEVNGKDRTPNRCTRQKENGIFNYSPSENKIPTQNGETNSNSSPDKIDRKSRSPLTLVECNNLNHDIEINNLSPVNLTKRNHVTQKEQNNATPIKVLQFENHIEQKINSPKKVLHFETHKGSANKNKTPIKKALISEDSVVHVSPKKLKLISEDVCGEDASPSKSGSTVKALDFDDQADNDMFGDEFGMGDFEEECKEDLDLIHMQRCEVMSVKRHATRIELRLKNASNNQATCFLEGVWLDTPLSPGEVISVTAPRDSSGQYCVGNTAGLLALRPDHLISSTSVVAGVFCKRKAVLQERYRGIDSANTAMTIGILIHELVQKALTERIMDASRLRAETDKIIKESLQMLYDAGLSEEEANSNMQQYIAPLAAFMQTYTGGFQSNGKPQKDQWAGQIDKVLDIEENLCCPQLGLKGKIDATLQVTIHERKGRQRAIVPLELKSGKASASAEHRGQLVLYGMMLSLLRKEDPTRSEQRGLLLYLKERVDVREVSCGYPERRDLMMLRNQLVQYLASSPQDVDPEQLTDIEDASCLLQQRLPEPVHHQTACQKCPYLTICSLHLWHTDGPSVSESHPLSKLQSQALGHLSPDHVKYFLHWTALLKMEERGQMSASPLHALWTDSTEKRAKKGTCAANLKLKCVKVSGDRHLHTFERQTKPIETLNEDSRAKGPQEGEFSIVSLDGRPWVAAGVVTAASDREIAIVLERDLSSRLDKDTVFHIDTYESYASTVQNLTNLGVLLEDSERSERLRKLIIDKDPPRFSKKLPREVGRLGSKLMRSLNIEQQRAVLKAVAAEDYALLQGLPGTGKTQTVSVLIQMLVGLKLRVLVTAHTHSAVDNVLSRLPEPLRVMRLGSSSRVAAHLSHRCEQQLTAACSTPEQLTQLYQSMEVVGVTCLGANHAMLSRTIFDVCIVDEATQVLQCTVLRPLFAARRFVLVGDPEQLPPVVRSRAARRLGMEESLFHRLMSDKATSTLQLQYRMNQPLAAIANIVAYNDKLRCADQSVAEATLAVNLEKLSIHPSWVLSACSPEPALAGLFLNMEPVEAAKTHENKCANVDEACVVLAIVDALVEGGVKPSEIGVIAPYRQQVALLRAALSRRGAEGSTVDQFQGRDKSVVLYTCTKHAKSGPEQGTKEGEILNDQRRLAVSVTRAKHKLIIVGNARALHRYEPLKKLISACKSINIQNDDVSHVVNKYKKEFLLF